MTDEEIPFVIGSWSQPALPEAFFSLVLAWGCNEAAVSEQFDMHQDKELPKSCYFPCWNDLIHIKIIKINHLELICERQCLSSSSVTA